MLGTTIDESKKLLESGLRVETADMYWEPDHNCLIEVFDLHPAYRFSTEEFLEYCKRPKVTPAWSEAALLNILPPTIELNGHIFPIIIGRLADNVSWYISYEYDHWIANIIKGLTLLDCAQKMILCLLETGYIKIDK